MSDYIGNKVLIGLGVICAALAAADFIYPRHGSYVIEEQPLVYCVFGFVVYVTVIFIARALRHLVIRPEDYYGPEATDREDEETAGTEARDA